MDYADNTEIGEFPVKTHTMCSYPFRFDFRPYGAYKNEFIGKKAVGYTVNVVLVEDIF